MSEDTKTDEKPENGDETSSGNDYSFQAEVARLLHLMVHSVYSEREIFLRELISNAADACDRLRHLAITEPDLTKDDPDLKITIHADKDAKALSIADNGIGMDRDELIENLGTIARSGTKAFIDKLGQGEDGVSLIGQFGVGFYSAFMAADRVEVLSRKAGTDKAHIWSSDGEGRFSVEPAEGPTAEKLVRGTVVTLHLKEDAQDYLEDAEIGRIVRAYSDHISFPIVLAGGEEPEQLNRASALWTRPKSDISDEQYTEFYRHAAAQFDEPAITVHYRAEGRHEYTVLLFVPSSRPFDLYDPNRSGRVKLYVRRVFITDDAEMLPAYLRFVRGVIDSEDVPLNISREMLQNNPIVGAIRKGVTGRILSELAKVAKDEEKYLPLWEAFGGVLKEGLYEDPERRDEIFEVSRFRSTSGDGWRALKDVVADFKENQTAIYYMVGESQEQLQSSPQLEGFKARGVEVLLLTDPVDNFWVATALGYDGKPFQSVTQGEADLSTIPLLEDESEAEAPDSPAMAALVGRLKTLLAEHVGDVRISKRLVESPACLVAPQGGPDRGLDKIMERQQGHMGQNPDLEINAGHALVKGLEERSRASDQADFEDLAWLLLDQARLLEGNAPADPAKFAQRLNRLVLAGLETGN